MGLKCHLFKLKIKEEPMLTFEKSKNNILKRRCNVIDLNILSYILKITFKPHVIYPL